MSKAATLTLFYSAVALICAAILFISIKVLRPTLDDPYRPPEIAVKVGKTETEEWFDIEKDLEAVDQAGAKVKLSDLRGKVWVVAEFFAVCPHCAVRNGAELRTIYDEFKSNPDFHMVCISVDPTVDTPEKLKEYSTALGADVSNWWFLNAGSESETHHYLENELKFFGIRERTDPNDIEANGRFAHDLGILLVNREMQVIGKWPLADARSEDGRKIEPKGYERMKAELFERIRKELSVSETQE